MALRYNDYSNDSITDNRDFFTAICFKDGYMEDGNIFCKAGKRYNYILIEEDPENCLIRLKSESDIGFAHSMDWEFFNEYYRIDNGDFIKAKEMQL